MWCGLLKSWQNHCKKKKKRKNSHIAIILSPSGQRTPLAQFPQLSFRFFLSLAAAIIILWPPLSQHCQGEQTIQNTRKKVQTHTHTHSQSTWFGTKAAKNKYAKPHKEIILSLSEFKILNANINWLHFCKSCIDRDLSSVPLHVHDSVLLMFLFQGCFLIKVANKSYQRQITINSCWSIFTN